MAYSTTNPPGLMAAPVGGGGGQIWRYRTTETVSAVTASSFFSNGAALGMLVGDAVHVVSVSTAGAFADTAFLSVSVVTAAAGATAVTLTSTST
jgi:hypothetical protein